MSYTWFNIMIVLLVGIDAATITMTTVAALGSNAQMTGTLTGQTNPQQYKIVLYVRSPSNAWWGPKPYDAISFPVGADGTFTIQDWASDQNDLTAPGFGLYAIPVDFAAIPARDSAMLELSSSVANLVIDRATWQPAGAQAPISVAPPAASTGTITFTPPNSGSAMAFSGNLQTSPATPNNFKIVVYVRSPENQWWGPKPYRGATYAVSNTGTFTVNNWASDPKDATAPGIAVLAIPVTATAPTILGGPELPAALLAMSVATSQKTRGGQPLPSVAVPSPPAAVASTASLTVTIPPLGSMADITGRVTGLINPTTAYKILLYVVTETNEWWGPKPQAGVFTNINADNSFTITNWASSPNDANVATIVVYCVPFSFQPPTTLGSAAPAGMGTAAIMTAQVIRTNAPQTVTRTGSGGGGPVPTPIPVPDPPAGGKGTITITLPATGSANALAGTVTGLTNPNNYKIVVYVRSPENQWWGPKAALTSTYPIGANGAFNVPDWASNPNDINAPGMGLFAIPNTANAPGVLGAPALPGALISIAAAQIVRDRAGGNAPVPPAPGPPAPGPPAPGPAAGELAWPPTAVPGAKRGAANGFINFAGYRWVVKNSGNGRVGPGNNMFSPSMNNVWVDDWGLHLNIVPTAGCGNWAASEVWLDRTLGYGTYLHRVISPIQNLDPDVTWSPFFLWDDSGNAGNGWREIDFEHARWGNAGDPTSSQYVLRPLQAGGMVPGWRIRYQTNNVQIISGAGQGGGACNNPGQDNFNGAGISKTTCVLKWFRNLLAWYCFDGLWTLDSIQNAPASKLISAYYYPQQFNNFIPDVGDNRVHINLWLQNGNAPRWGRRAHGIINGFEFRPNDVPINNARGDFGIARRGLLSVPTGEEGEHMEVAEEGRLLEATEVHSNGDPTGQGYTVTMENIRLEAASTEGGLLTGGFVGGADTGKPPALSPPEIAGAVIGTVIGAIGLFAAGFITARRRYISLPGFSSEPAAQQTAQSQQSVSTTRSSHVRPA